MTRRISGPLYVLVAIMLLSPASGGAAMVDHSTYGELLEQYVRNGVVDYRGLKQEEARLDEYLKLLENTDLSRLGRDETYAFYVNAYNAWTLKVILSAYPGIKSIRELGVFSTGPWKKKIVRVDGRVISLDDVEHGILRKEYDDPRVHFAVNCASKSCPPLISEPYQGDILDQQMDTATRNFLNDRSYNYLEGNTLHVSRLFKWYSEDFPDGAVPFFLTYARGKFKQQLEARKNRPRVKYLDYDWSLNGK
ncbi:hypothetical protein D3OALGB2SA_5087 [Olavius algarvensis associated proteobacterium Delta 3]|nr:hypothetical protein D3OALGB2SA_5087 [Olavius algarvensis associated proteobacterium Delta 3]